MKHTICPLGLGTGMDEGQHHKSFIDNTHCYFQHKKLRDYQKREFVQRRETKEKTPMHYSKCATYKRVLVQERIRKSFVCKATKVSPGTRLTQLAV